MFMINNLFLRPMKGSRGCRVNRVHHRPGQNMIFHYRDARTTRAVGAGEMIIPASSVWRSPIFHEAFILKQFRDCLPVSLSLLFVGGQWVENV